MKYRSSLLAKAKYTSFANPYVLFLLTFLLVTSTIMGQKEITTTDTLEQPVEAIKAADILMQLGEASVQTRRLAESMIADEKIEELELSNQQLLNKIDSVLKLDKSIAAEEQSVRFLKNKLHFWKKSASLLDDEKSSLNISFQDINQKSDILKADIDLWNNTKASLDENKEDPTVKMRIDEVVSTQDSVRQIGQNKGNRILVLLDLSAEKAVVLDEYLSMLDQIIISKQGYFKSMHDPIYSAFDFVDKSIWNLQRPLKEFYNMEIIGFLNLLKMQIVNVIFSLVFIVLIIMAFRMFKRWITKATNNLESVHQQMLRKVISRSISASIIISLLFLAIIFADAPELLNDIIKLFIIVPLVLISTTFLSKTFHLYAYLFGFLVVLTTAGIIFPDDNK